MNYLSFQGCFLSRLLYYYCCCYISPPPPREPFTGVLNVARVPQTVPSNVDRADYFHIPSREGVPGLIQGRANFARYPSSHPRQPLKSPLLPPPGQLSRGPDRRRWRRPHLSNRRQDERHRPTRDVSPSDVVIANKGTW